MIQLQAAIGLKQIFKYLFLNILKWFQNESIVAFIVVIFEREEADHEIDLLILFHWKSLKVDRTVTRLFYSCNLWAKPSSLNDPNGSWYGILTDESPWTWCSCINWYSRLRLIVSPGCNHGQACSRFTLWGLDSRYERFEFIEPSITAWTRAPCPSFKASLPYMISHL